MATFWYYKTVTKMFEKGTNAPDLDGDAGIKIGLSNSTHVPNQDDAFLDDAGADDFVDGEFNGTGYAGGFNGAGRKALSGKTVDDDTTNNRAVWDATDPATWTGFNAGTIAQATVMLEVSTNADSPLIINLDFPDVNPNGNDFTLQFASTGIGYGQSVAS